MTDWGRRVFLGTLVGAFVGVLVGIVISWVLWRSSELSTSQPPPSLTVVQQEVLSTSTVEEEKSGERDEAIVLVSAFYALDGDLERARERLAALGLDDAGEQVAHLTLLHASLGNRQIAVDLATLAAALGYGQGEILAYVATATPPRTPLPTHTPAPTNTPIPTPTDTPAPTATPTDTPVPTPTRPRPTRQPQPPTTTPPPPAATPQPLIWDHRVDLFNPPVRLVQAGAAPGEQYWRLVGLEWWKAWEGGNTMIYINTLNENGQMVWGQEVVVEHGPKDIVYTDPKPGESYGANYPMSATLNSYQVYVGGNLPSERVTGLGLGETYGGLDHTTFVLVFQRSRK